MSQVPNARVEAVYFSSAGGETAVSSCLSAPIAIECARTTTNDFCRSPTADTRHPKRQAENIVYAHPFSYHRAGSLLEARSEERRVGKECMAASETYRYIK